MGPGTDPRPDERAIMEGIAAGDSAALGQIYDRYHRLVYGLVLRVLGHRQEAEEVLGDVFWELWERGDRYQSSRGSVQAYLVTLARSRALDRLRQRRRRPVLVGTEDTGPAAGEATDPGPDPLAGALLSQRRRQVVSALEGLDPGQRRAIELSFYGGLSHGEIAAELRAPLGTVKTHIRKGLLRLRESLQAVYAGESAP